MRNAEWFAMCAKPAIGESLIYGWLDIYEKDGAA
jgi:hypothetical protein